MTSKAKTQKPPASDNNIIRSISVDARPASYPGGVYVLGRGPRAYAVVMSTSIAHRTSLVAGSNAMASKGKSTTEY